MKNKIENTDRCKACGSQKWVHDQFKACKKFVAEDVCKKGKCGFGELCEPCKKKLKGWFKEWKKDD